MRKTLISLALFIGMGTSSFAQLDALFFAPSGCETATLEFISNSFEDLSDPIDSVFWDFGGVTDSIGTTTMHSFADLGSGAYLVTLTVKTESGATDSKSLFVTIYDNPVLESLDIPSSGCVGDPITFTAVDSFPDNANRRIADYVWNYDDPDDPTVGRASQVSFTYDIQSSFITVTVTYTSEKGCSGQSTGNLTVVNGPTASFTNNIACLGNPTEFVNTSTVGTLPLDYSMWYFSDPLSGNNDTMTIGTGDVSHTYSNVGDYGDTLIIYDTFGCIDTAIQTVEVASSARVLTIIGNNTFFDGNSVLLEASNSEFESYEWSTGATTIGIKVTPEIEVGEDSTYTLTVEDNSGCFLEASIVLSKIEPILVAKNLFTPNGDGKNDTWIIDDLSNYSSCTVQIYNRWGVLVYSAEGYANDWKGTYQGNALPEGGYFYSVDCSEEGVSGTGSITLLR